MNALIEHIKAINAKTAAWVAEDPKNRWAGLLVEDLAHWTSQDVNTPEEFEHYILTTEVYEFHKTVHGFRPNYAHLKAMSMPQLQAEMDLLRQEWESQRESIRKARIQRKLTLSQAKALRLAGLQTI